MDWDDEKQTCGNCFYFRDEVCKRYPRVYLSNSELWKNTPAFRWEWCGEWGTNEKM